MRIGNWFKNIGPGPLIAAAFIGPGTVTVCTLAGVNFGYALLWAMVFSIVSTVILQEMAARLGIVTQKGLAEIIKTEIKGTYTKTFFIVLILSAIVIGNTAYEAGNISGGVLGLQTIFGEGIWEIGSLSVNVFSLLIGFIAFLLLYFGNYKVLEKSLVGLVIFMSLAFLITAIITKPDLLAILRNSFSFQTPKGSLFTIIAIIGTTVVPYNLFLHASLVKEKWQSANQLPLARKDTFIAIIVGGLVSMCIIITGAAISTQEIKSAADLAMGLEPLFGSFAKYVLSIGLFAAGITSAITAPLAAAYVASGCLGWSSHFKSKKFRLTWMVILWVGVVFSSLGIKFISIIQFAQVANGLLLPVIAIFLIWAMNRGNLLGTYKNKTWQNILGITIVGVTLFLGIKSIFTVFNSF